MAKLEVMPQKDVIDAFRGVVDFYRWCGLVIARSWPRGDYRFRSEAVKASQIPFSYIAQAYSALPGTVRELYDPLASHGGLTAKDWATRLYINGYKNVREHPQPVPEQGLGADPMMRYENEAEPMLVNSGSINANTPWIDVDLAAHCPLDVQFVAIRTRFQDRSGAVQAGDHNLWLRRKGAVQPQQLSVSDQRGGVRMMIFNDTIITMDSGRKMQWKVTVPGAAGNVILQAWFLAYYA